MKHIRPLYVASLTEGEAEAGYVVLRDGTTARIRLAESKDRSALQMFVEGLSRESKRHRFFSETDPPVELLASLCDNSEPRSLLTLLVTRTWNDEQHIVAAGSYLAKEDTTAEIALAVDDAFHGKGLGTLLLERLALLAIQHGFLRLWAVTHADNLAMRDVFKESGFVVHEAMENGDMEIDVSLVPTPATVARSEIRERLAATASLRPFFQPRSVAVIGASRDPAKIGSKLLDALITSNFKGPIYPINRHASQLHGLRAYPSMHDVPNPVDVAIIAVPCDAVLSVVDECANRNVRGLIVITAGFAEVNANGRELQTRLVQRVREHGMRMVGPNCFGLINADPAIRLNATFSTNFPPFGRVAISSQSGALGLAILAAARRLHFGISTFISVGNKADVSVNDLLQYWEEDPSTEVILLYVESFGNPRRFARIARRVAHRKPIIAVKAGRTLSGSRAAGSHTAALAERDVAIDALFHQAGVIRAETLEELFALATGLSSQPLPAGRRVAMVTNSGGPAILCADACEAGGLIVPSLSEQTKTCLAAFLPSAAALNNPVDLIASATSDQYRQAVEALLRADEVDALIVLYTSVTKSDNSPIAGGIVTGVMAGRAAGANRKPVLVCWMAECDHDRAFATDRETIPAYPYPETPATVLSHAASYAQWRTQPIGMIADFDDLHVPLARAICEKAVAEQGGGWLNTEDTRAVLTAMQLPILAGGVARTADEAAKVATHIGFPVVVKLASHRLVHKTEIGGVRLNLNSETSVREAFGAIQERLARDHNLDVMEGVLVQPMLHEGIEVMIGMTQDRVFGPLIAFGLGGIHVEILGDVRFRITPLTDHDAAAIIREIKGYRLLEGYRGHPAADIEAIEETLLRVSRLVEEVHEITELDLNPILALPPGKGCRIVDARIRVGRPL